MKKKICIIASNLLTINVFFKDIIEKISNEYNITIVSNVPNNEILILKNIKYTSIPISRKISIINDLKSIVLFSYNLISAKYDMVLSVTPKAGLISAIASFIGNKKIRIHYFTGQVWITKKGIYKIFLKFLDKFIGLANDHILVDSKGQYKFLVDQKIINKRKSNVLGLGSISGIDCKKYKFDKDFRKSLREHLGLKKNDVVILFVGRFVKDKGINTLLKAFKKIKSENKNCYLLLVGSDEEGLIKKFKNEHYNFENIIIEEWKEEIEKWYSVADIYCLPSYREGLGHSILEASSSSLPTVCSNIYGLQSSIRNNETGIFFNLKKKDDLYKKLNILIEDKKLRLRMGIKAREFILENFEKKIVIRNFCDFLELKLSKKCKSLINSKSIEN